MTGSIPSAVDVVVVGSGAAALAGAITAADAGLSVLILEKTDKWGGTTACSGGGMWVPNHPLMAENGMADSREESWDYLTHAVGDCGPPTAPERMAAFIDAGPEMVAHFGDLGMRWEFTYYPDYYPQLPGAKVGRGLACPIIDGSGLGGDLKTLRQQDHPIPLVFERHEFLALLAPFRKLGHLWTLARIFARTLRWKLSGRTALLAGRATMGELMRLARKSGADLLLEADVEAFERHDGRVDSVLFRHNGRHVRVQARKAVLVAAGGYSRNDAFRRRYQPMGGEFTTTAPGDTGQPIEAAMALGADTALMEEGWWMPVVRLPDGTNSLTLTERSLPHSLIVDQHAQRYLNEAQPYCDCGRAMLDHAGTEASWLIMDSRHRDNYAFTYLGARQMPRDWLDGGFMIKAASLRELAGKTRLDAAALSATIDRFNGFARKGVDEDYQRGGNRFDNGWGDPFHGPNPNLGTLEKPPFYAIRIWPGDLGTKGGLLTDGDGRVMDRDGNPIAGLYAAGNSAASVMGRCYPGPGGTLGPAMVYAWRAMRHAAGEQGEVAS